MAIDIQLVLCGTRPSPMIEAYVRTRALDLANEFPSLTACSIAIEGGERAGVGRVRMALRQSDARPLFVSGEAPMRRLADDCADVIDRGFGNARRSLRAARESAIPAYEAA